MAKRPCARPGCPTLVVKGYCEAHTSHTATMQCEAKRPSSTQRGYGYRWQQYTALRLREYPLCEGLKLKPDGLIVVNTHPGIVRAAKLTDHIIPHKGDEILMWAEWNHQSACDDCHNVKTSQYDGGFGNKGNGINARGRG